MGDTLQIKGFVAGLCLDLIDECRKKLKE
ncbi:uncharacterized protein METZ01_LOCUS157024, partial [marine metagenome]